jgi:hypothetical protein
MPLAAIRVIGLVCDKVFRRRDGAQQRNRHADVGDVAGRGRGVVLVAGVAVFVFSRWMSVAEALVTGKTSCQFTAILHKLLRRPPRE